MGDLGVHMVDCVRWMLGLGWPTSIQSHGGIYVDNDGSANVSDTQFASFRFPEVEVTWQHRTWGAKPIPERHWTDLWGAKFIGDKGTLNITMVSYDFTPADGGPIEGFNMMSKTGNLGNLDFDTFTDAYAAVQRAHVLDFMKAIQTRARPIADIEEGHISTACCILANLSDELGRGMRYDPKTLSVVGDDEATRRLARAYRAPWVHPEPTKV
jgi:predicted dehydrogenase